MDYHPPLIDIAPHQFSSFIKQFSTVESFSKPHEFAWEITNKCNLKCKHCFVHDTKDVSNEGCLKTEECFQIIDQLKNLGIFSIIFSGGEPFSRDDFLKIIKYTKTKNISVIIQTNSLLLNGNLVNELGKILHPKMDMLQVSLDGSTQKTHEKIRGPNTFHRTIKNINKIVKKNINLRINFTPTSVNLLEMPETFLLCNSIKVPYFDFSIFMELKNQKHLVPDDILLIKAAAEVIDLSVNSHTKLSHKLDINWLYKKNIRIAQKYTKNLRGNNINIKTLRCSNTFRSMSMRSDGKISLCIPASSCNAEIFTLGNARNQKIEDIWKNRVNNIIYIGRDPEKTICFKRKCPYIDTCQSGCIAKSYLYSGDVYAPDPRCNIVKEL